MSGTVDPKIEGSLDADLSGKLGAAAEVSEGCGGGHMRRRFQNARKLDSAVDFVRATTADQKLPEGPRPPLRMGGPSSLAGFSETFVTGVFSQAIVNNDKVDETAAASSSSLNHAAVVAAARTADSQHMEKK